MPCGEEHPGDVGHQRFRNVLRCVAVVGQPPTGVQRASVADHKVKRPDRRGSGANGFLVADLHTDYSDLLVTLCGKVVQRVGAGRGAAGGGDMMPGSGGLAGHFQPDTAVGPSDQYAIRHWLMWPQGRGRPVK